MISMITRWKGSSRMKDKKSNQGQFGLVSDERMEELKELLRSKLSK